MIVPESDLFLIQQTVIFKCQKLAVTFQNSEKKNHISFWNGAPYQVFGVYNRDNNWLYIPSGFYNFAGPGTQLNDWKSPFLPEVGWREQLGYSLNLLCIQIMTAGETAEANVKHSRANLDSHSIWFYLHRILSQI